MKLDYVYFRNKMWDVFEMAHMEYNTPWYETENAIKILRQIAKDAFAAGAEAQRVAIDEKLSHEFYFRRGPNSEEPIMYASEILAAINTATVKEVPGV